MPELKLGPTYRPESGRSEGMVLSGMQRLVSKFCAALGLLFVSLPAFADDPIRITVDVRTLQPGELVVAHLALPEDATGAEVTAFGRTTTAVRAHDSWTALVGIAVEQKPGAYRLLASANVRGAKVAGALSVDVAAQQFV